MRVDLGSQGVQSSPGKGRCESPAFLFRASTFFDKMKPKINTGPTAEGQEAAQKVRQQKVNISISKFKRRRTSHQVRFKRRFQITQGDVEQGQHWDRPGPSA